MDVVQMRINDRVLVFDERRCRFRMSPWRPDAEGVGLCFEYPAFLNKDGSNGVLWKVMSIRITPDEGMTLDLEDGDEVEIELSAKEQDEVTLLMRLPEGWDWEAEPRSPEADQDEISSDEASDSA